MLEEACFCFILHDFFPRQSPQLLAPLPSRSNFSHSPVPA
jgi:hypothetical protein